MRPSLVLLALLAVCAAPVVAEAAVRIHMPHGRHHHRADGQAASPQAPAPTADVPEAIWSSSKSHR